MSFILIHTRTKKINNLENNVFALCISSFSHQPRALTRSDHQFNTLWKLIPPLCSLSHRLGRRKILFEKRKKISDYALVMGMFGIIIMVIENELSSAGVYNKEDLMSTGLKTLISISTVVLLVLIVAYHMLEIQVTIPTPTQGNSYDPFPYETTGPILTGSPISRENPFSIHAFSPETERVCVYYFVLYVLARRWWKEGSLTQTFRKHCQCSTSAVKVVWPTDVAAEKLIFAVKSRGLNFS